MSTSARLLDSDLVNWKERLAAEESALRRVVDLAPSKRIIDLGSGTGEHARRLAGWGCEVVAIDASEEAILRAQEAVIDDEIDARVQYILTDMGAVERSVRGHFGGAICLGNTLPQLLSPESVSRMLVGLKRRLQPGAPVLLQLLNYDRIFATGEPALPVRITPHPEGDLVLVRLVQPRPDGIVVHTTSVLRHRPREHPSMELVDTRAHQWRGWRLPELETLLGVARLPVRETWGDMSGAPFDADRSDELVVLAG